jgi:hypothetical protein
VSKKHLRHSSCCHGKENSSEGRLLGYDAMQFCGSITKVKGKCKGKVVPVL